ncbi:hypothetical protein K2X83_02285, partial [Patescibacteria group bacterium]|nr:hypothetical protein [Patescibacteria group bacterium]
MSTLTVVLLLAAAVVVGIAAGYFLRLLVALGQKGSAEIQVKQKLLEAREQAKNILSEGEKQAAQLEVALRDEFRVKEEALVAKEKRVGEKESYLDKRQL